MIFKNLKLTFTQLRSIAKMAWGKKFTREFNISVVESNCKGRKRVCKKCPFRKKPTWMNRFALVLNQARILKYKQPQQCHTNLKTICLGSVVCLRGGDKDIISPKELEELKPLETPEECREAYGYVRKTKHDYEKTLKGKHVKTSW